MRSTGRFIFVTALILAVIALPGISKADNSQYIVCPTISDVLDAAVGEQVSVAGKAVSTIFYGDRGDQIGFAIEEPDRFAGIRVISDVVVTPGENVTVDGTVVMDNGERAIAASSVAVGMAAMSELGINIPPAPFRVHTFHASQGQGNTDVLNAVVNDATAPSGPELYKGVRNVGILTVIRGKVTAKHDTNKYSGYFYVDDAGTITDIFGEQYDTGLNDGSGHIGMRCRPAPSGTSKKEAKKPSTPEVGDYVEVKGVVGVQQIDGINVRYLWTESWHPASVSTYTTRIAHRGLNLISLPAQPNDSDPAAVFDGFSIDGRLYAWDAATQGLCVFDLWDVCNLGTITNSRGYWLDASSTGDLSYIGYEEVKPLDRWISTPEGWNIVGVPFTHNTYWADWKATDGSAMMSIIEAGETGLLESIAYGWDPDTQQLVAVDPTTDLADGSGQFNQWQGYWVKVNQDLALVAPAASIAL